MPGDPLAAGQLILQAGAAGVLLVGVFAIVVGKLRTSQEIDAWQKRAERAETQVDTVLPLLNKLADEVVPMVGTIEAAVKIQRDTVLPSLERIERELRESRERK